MLMDSPKFRRAPIQNGLSITFCGHTYGTHLRQVLSHLYLDTGAFITHPPFSYDEDEGYGLTLFNVKEASWVRASYLNPEVILSGTRPGYGNNCIKTTA
jgi:serine/threonine protein phosphatase 1